MTTQIQRYQTPNYDYPVLQITAHKPQTYSTLQQKIDTFLDQKASEFHVRDAGTVFCIITVQNTQYFGDYLEICSQYANKNSMKAWGYNSTTDDSMIFISFVDSAV